MPSFIRRRRLSRRVILITLLLALAGSIVAFFQVGSFIAREDPLMKADAIFVFAGTRVERPLEAVDLYREGWAPRIVVTRAVAEQALPFVERHGVRIPTDFDLNTDVLRALGVPPHALVTPDRVHDNTGHEAETLRDLAQRHGWRRIIIVSSKYHLRRAALACRRELSGTGVEIIRRGSRYDASKPGRWWTSRPDIRWLMSEVPKLTAYKLGIGT